MNTSMGFKNTYRWKAFVTENTIERPNTITAVVAMKWNFLKKTTTVNQLV